MTTQDVTESVVADVSGSPAIEVLGLVKRFDEVTAVDGIFFDVRRGEVFALLGPNGAGKSTAIRMLCTLSRPTAGTARVAGCDIVAQPNAVRRRIGLVFQEQTLDQQLTAEENLRFHAVLYRMPPSNVEPRIARVLDLVGLTERRKDLVSTFSGGMARRLEIARGMLHTPDVLFLDEPTVGLDPQTRALMWEDVLRLRDEEGVTVLLTTHYMEEAEYADRIAIIDQGRIVALDTPTALKAVVGADTVALQTVDDRAASAALVAAGRTVEPGADGIIVAVVDGEASVPALIAEAGVPVRSVHVHRPTLDDVFMHFTGREIREGGAVGQSGMVRAWSRRR
jgi:ABC-2 type transport system ATP-binding protein